MARGTAGPALAPAGDRPDPAGGRMDEALKVAAVQAEETGGLGRPGRPVNKRSPFFIGMTAAAGVAVTYGARRAGDPGPVGAGADRPGAVHRDRP